MITAVIFDMDGVLADSEQMINEAAIAGLREYGIEPQADDFLPFVGMGEDRYIGGVARKYGLTYGPEIKRRVYEIYFGLIDGRLTAFPGVHDLLGRLRIKKVPLAVASSADRIKIEANLKAINVDPAWFQAIVAGDEVPRIKPAPDVYLAAAEKLSAAPANCCVIEDSISGIRAAKSAGMRCVVVAQTFAASELQTASPDCIRPDVGKISLTDIGLSTVSG